MSREDGEVTRTVRMVHGIARSAVMGRDWIVSIRLQARST